MANAMMDNFQKDENMAKGSIPGRMVMRMMENSMRIKDRDWEPISGMIKEFIGESGKKIE
jgi:hypothetical protein